MKDIETRCVEIHKALTRAVPGQDVEIVDAVSVYVNFEFATAVCVTPDADRQDFVEINVTEWDRSGGVHSEFLLADQVREEFVPVIVKAFLDEHHRRQMELEAHLEQGGAVLVDPDSFTHMQQVDNDGSPIGDPIPLRKDT